MTVARRRGRQLQGLRGGPPARPLPTAAATATTTAATLLAIVAQLQLWQACQCGAHTASSKQQPPMAARGRPPPTPPPPLVVACSVPGMAFCRRELPIAQRAADLVGRLTLEEKIAQLSTYSFAKEYQHRFTPPVPRLGLPGYSYHTEGLHGLRDSYVAGMNATLYPQVTAMAATANATLIHEMARVMGVEARAVMNVNLRHLHSGGRGGSCNASACSGNITDIQTRGGFLSIFGPTMNLIRAPSRSLRPAPCVPRPRALGCPRSCRRAPRPSAPLAPAPIASCVECAAFKLRRERARLARGLTTLPRLPALAPCLPTVGDPRWGRAQESVSEVGPRRAY